MIVLCYLFLFVYIFHIIAFDLYWWQIGVQHTWLVYCIDGKGINGLMAPIVLTV